LLNGYQQQPIPLLVLLSEGILIIYYCVVFLINTHLLSVERTAFIGSVLVIYASSTYITNTVLIVALKRGEVMKKKRYREIHHKNIKKKKKDRKVEQTGTENFEKNEKRGFIFFEKNFKDKRESDKNDN